MPLDNVNALITNAFSFYGAFFALHSVWLKALADAPRFHLWPRWEVLEILSGPDGVHGFVVHFSNGSRARLSRTPAGTEAINVVFEGDGRLNFMIGRIDQLEPV